MAMDDPRIATLVIGLIGAALALVAWLGDRRRMRRSDPDAVGIMPWTALFFWGTLGAAIGLGLAAKMWFAGG